MTVIVNQNDTVLVIAQSQNALIVGVGIQGLTGAATNVTGITGFTNGSGFTGNVTNNNLSIVLQNATANQSGQLAAGDWVLFNSTLGNVTLAQGNITAAQGNISLLQGNVTNAQGNITTAQNDIVNLSNHTTSINSTISGHIGNFTNPHNVTATQLNLGNVDNTSDLDKPISNLTQTALNAKLDANQKGATNGVAELVGGTVPSAQLPSYVDDVIEAANFAALPVTGEAGKIYVTLDTNLTYRWSGSAYAEISASLALGELSSTAYRGDRGAIAYNHSQETGNPHNATTANISDSTNRRYVTDSQLVNVTNLSGTNTGDETESTIKSKLNITTISGNNTGDQDLSGYVPSGRTVNGENLTTNITIQHQQLGVLGWIDSGHTGGNLTCAFFNENSEADLINISGNGTSILSNNNAGLGTPASGNLTNCNGTAANLTAGNVTNINVSNVTGILPKINGGTNSTVSKTLVQSSYLPVTSASNNTGTIPLDNSIPQNTEGSEFFTLSHTPLKTTNTLKITVLVFLSNNTSGVSVTCALFQDSTASALKANAVTVTANYVNSVSVYHEMTAGTTSETTFKVRIGGTAGTTYLNSNSSASFFNGTAGTFIKIEEYE